MSIHEETLGNLIASALEEPKSPVGTFTLPGGVYINGEVHKKIGLREISGHEEDLLGNPKIPAEDKLDQLIRQVITSIGPVEDRKVINESVTHMLTGDRAFIVIALRRLSLGDIYDFIVECPECSHKELQHVDLNSLEIKETTENRMQETTLPSGKKVLWHFMTGFDENRNNTLKNKEKDLLSIGIAARVDSLDGQPSDMSAIKSLSARDRNQLRELFQEKEPGIDMNLELTCARCGCEYEKDMDIDIGFFFPSQVQKRSKKRY